ncbi:MAG: hypothetical protein AAF687_05315 [Pseudomonadota bacterium]
MRLKARQAKQAHQRVAIFLALFLGVHFATHFSALGGIAAQDAVMQIGRAVYRIPVIEIAVVIALAAQVYLGIDLLRRISARKRKDRWHWVQFASGCYLAYFIVQHTIAALVSRLGFGLDTNFYWAAGTLTLDPLRAFFAPYYILVVVALTAHLIAALHFRGPRRWHAPALAIGPLGGITIVMAYGGALYPIELPQSHRDFFAAFPGVES